MRRVWLLFLYYLGGRTVLLCKGPYFNVCSGNGTDFNVTEADDLYCDCDKETNCFLLEFPEVCNTTTIVLNTYLNITDSNQLKCDISNSESQEVESLSFEFLNQSDDKIFLKILTENDFGKYKIVCDVLEITDKIEPKWEILFIIPSEVLVDSKINLELTVIGQNKMNSSIVCFVKTPDDIIEILLAVWVSDIQIECLGFTSLIPGVFDIVLGSKIPESFLENSISLTVNSKSPVALQAEYSSDLKFLFINFDNNIELQSTCSSAFLEESFKCFGNNFECFSRGNTLVVEMGLEIQLLDSLKISSNNNICRSGSHEAGMCLFAIQKELPVLKPKVSGPNLCFFSNFTCETDSSQKYTNIKVLTSKHPISTLTDQIHKTTESSGKTQRKNLIIWKAMRKILSKFNSDFNIQANATEVLPIFENFQSLENFMVADSNVGNNASVSVFVQPSSNGSIMMEATVTFCTNPPKYHHKWFINSNEVLSDGRLATFNGLFPGKYVIKCVIIDSTSGEVYGQGWTTTEILPKYPEVLVIPSEITLGIENDVFLRVVTKHDMAVLWKCRTSLNQFCFTTTGQLISNVLDLKSNNISIPAGILPVGEYVWTIEDAIGSNTGKIFIQSKSAAIEFIAPYGFVTSLKTIEFRGIIVSNERNNCKGWWSSVRRKGFDFYKLETVENEEQIQTNESATEIPLILSPHLEKTSAPDLLYLFKFQIFCPEDPANLNYVSFPVKVSNPPLVSNIKVEPLMGEAMITEFVVSGGEVKDVEDRSLLFEWRYVDSCKMEVPIKSGYFSRNFTIYLPPGEFYLIVQVCDGKNLCTTTKSLNLSVVQSTDFPLENFKNARKQMEYLIASGNTLEAFGLATTVFKSLALVSESEIREEIYSTLEESIKNKINDLQLKIKSNPKAVKFAVDFFERAVSIAKYFRKGSDILYHLNEFKKSYE